VDWERKYDLTDLPKRAQLHVRFLNLKTDEDLIGFMRAWGPLWQTLPAQIVTPCLQYWAFQKRLKAALELARNAPFSDAAGLKAAILEYVAADDDYHQQGPIGKPGEAGLTAFNLGLLYAPQHLRLRNPENVPHPKEWIPNASLSALREVAADCLRGGFDFGLRAAWKGGRLHYAWKPAVSTLAGAIELSLWNSLTGERPVGLCDECGIAFLPESAHAKKFCSYGCAHRVAMRAWRKRNPEGQHERKGRKHAKAKKA